MSWKTFPGGNQRKESLWDIATPKLYWPGLGQHKPYLPQCPLRPSKKVCISSCNIWRNLNLPKGDPVTHEAPKHQCPFVTFILESCMTGTQVPLSWLLASHGQNYFFKIYISILWGWNPSKDPPTSIDGRSWRSCQSRALVLEDTRTQSSKPGLSDWKAVDGSLPQSSW